MIQTKTKCAGSLLNKNRSPLVKGNLISSVLALLVGSLVTVTQVHAGQGFPSRQPTDSMSQDEAEFFARRCLLGLVEQFGESNIVYNLNEIKALFWNAAYRRNQIYGENFTYNPNPRLQLLKDQAPYNKSLPIRLSVSPRRVAGTENGYESLAIVPSYVTDLEVVPAVYAIEDHKFLFGITCELKDNSHKVVNIIEIRKYGADGVETVLDTLPPKTPGVRVEGKKIFIDQCSVINGVKQATEQECAAQ